MNATKIDRADAIRRIVADNLNHDGGGMEAWFESILRTGFKGYENMTDDELATVHHGDGRGRERGRGDLRAA